MKFQYILPFLPVLAPLVAALPAAAPQPEPLDFSLTPLPLNFTAILAALPDFTPDDEENPANQADDELAEEETSLAPAINELERRGNNPSITWDADFKFKRRRRTIARGDTTITFWKNGDVRFRSHFKALRLLTYNYQLSCGLRDKAGRAYTLQRKGKICGILRSCSSTHTVDEKKNVEKVKQNWESIRAGDRIMYCRAQLKWDAAGALKEIMKILEKVGPIARDIIKMWVA